VPALPPPLSAPRLRARLAQRAGCLLAGVTQRAQRLTFAALEPNPGRPAPAAAWRAAIRAWLARLVVAGRGNREISAELFICVGAAGVHVSGLAGRLSVASRGGNCRGRRPARRELWGPLIVCTGYRGLVQVLVR
jgi:hypothetical protein